MLTEARRGKKKQQKNYNLKHLENARATKRKCNKDVQLSSFAGSKRGHEYTFVKTAPTKGAAPVSEVFFSFVLALQNAEICATNKCCATGIFTLPTLADDTRDGSPLCAALARMPACPKPFQRPFHCFYRAKSRREHVKVFPKLT